MISEGMETQLMIFVEIAKAGVNTVKVLEEHLHRKEFTVGFSFHSSAEPYLLFTENKTEQKKPQH